ncbi:hypothetical protein [Rhodanobacter sp. 115]|uniref:hypothetical protein n=1 Tax=Rhodanobacter sp. FW021-MT20 TaxID=1162282 RepID=UPI00056AA7BE|nr:hypothetical protein [Rhodanobacter sp. 115]
MINTNDADATRFEFPLTEKSNRTGQRLLLGKADIKELPVIAKCVLALLEFLPNVLEPTISLEGSCILVYVAPSLSAPANMTANDAHATCIDAVDTLTMTATEIMHNSERAKPLPLNAVVTHKNASRPAEGPRQWRRRTSVLGQIEILLRRNTSSYSDTVSELHER